MDTITMPSCRIKFCYLFGTSFAKLNVKIVQSPLYIWLYGISEKGSTPYYLGLKDFAPDQPVKNRLDTLISRKMGHIRTISNYRVAFKK
jgi:hypothetical protein